MIDAFFNENPLTELWLDHSNNETAFQYFNPEWDEVPHDIILWGKALGLEKIRKTQCNPKFVKLMDNRMIQGFFRYGPKEEQQGKYDYINDAIARLKRYVDTHNQECLVDAANIIRLEFDNPTFSDAYLESENDAFHCKIIK